MLGTTLDVKSNDASSTSSASDRSVDQKTETLGSGPSQSPSSGKSETPESLEDFLAKKFETESDHAESEDEEDKDSPELGEEALDSTVESNEEDKEKKESKEDEEPSKDKKEDEEDKPETKIEDLPIGKAVPYDRFKEVLTERNETKGKLSEYEQDVKVYRGVVQFCNENGITDQQYTAAMEIQAAINRGDVKTALAKLQPVVDSLKLATGDKLPEDIQKWVDDGGDLVVAKKWAADRGSKTISENLQRENSRRQNQSQADRMKTECSSASEQWLKDRVKTDPDFKPKSKATDPDGKFELVNMAFVAKISERDASGKYVNPIQGATSMISLLEQSYKSIDGIFKSTRRPATSKRLPTSGSSKSSTRMPLEQAIASSKSLEDAVGIMMESRGG